MADGNGGGGADTCVDTEARAPGGVFEADEDADLGRSSRGCKVVGRVEITPPNAAGGGDSGSEHGLGGVKVGEVGAGMMDKSGCSADAVKNVLDVDGATPSRCLLDRKLAGLRRPISSLLDGDAILLGTIDGHGAPSPHVLAPHDLGATRPPSNPARWSWRGTG